MATESISRGDEVLLAKNGVVAGQCFPLIPRESGLVVKGVNMGHTAGEKDKDKPLRTRGKMSAPRGRRMTVMGISGLEQFWVEAESSRARQKPTPIYLLVAVHSRVVHGARACSVAFLQSRKTNALA